MDLFRALRSNNARSQRGAALILAVVVIMVLTTLGIAMVTFTTTEERTAATYRDSVQVRAVAEAGVRAVQQMFFTPTDRKLVPQFQFGSTAGSGWDYYGTDETTTEATLNAIGIYRKPRTGATPARYVGRNNVFFQGPFNNDWGRVFAGVYSSTDASDIYDMRWTCDLTRAPAGSPAITSCWLNTNLNNMFAGTGLDDVGRVTEISFYAPPTVNGRAYGVCTVRVTAEKRTNGQLVARETLEAIIADNNPAPAILGNGNIEFDARATACGDGCEQIHANGDLGFNAPGGSTLSGGNPTVSAVGSVTGNLTVTPPAQQSAAYVTPPNINPYDLAYRPTTVAELGKYYLLTTRTPAAVWTDNNSGTFTTPVTCGLSTCLDYGLEYDSGGTARARTTTAYMYKWNDTTRNWDLQQTKTSGQTFTIGTTLQIDFTYTADSTVAGTGDNATSPPYNRLIVPMSTFTMKGVNQPNDSEPEQLVTLLVDGKVDTQGSIGQPNPWKVSLISVGSISISSSSDIRPAMSNRAMLISGRDIMISANMNNDLSSGSGYCPPTPALTSTQGLASGIIAAHEQIRTNAQANLVGLIIGENRVGYDPTVSGDALYFNAQTTHSYLCGVPSWPWNRPTKPIIVAMNSAGD